MIKDKKQEKNNKTNTTVKKRLSVHELIRKDKYVPQFKSLIEETKQIGKISFTKIKRFFTPEVIDSPDFGIVLNHLKINGIILLNLYKRYYREGYLPLIYQLILF